MTEIFQLASRLSIYHPAGQVGLGANVFGKDVANFELFQALARHGGLEQIDFLTHAPFPSEAITQSLADGLPLKTRISSSSILDQRTLADSGCLLRGSQRLEELAWQRRSSVGDRAYSLVGLIHTIAPPAMRHDIRHGVSRPDPDLGRADLHLPVGEVGAGRACLTNGRTI